MKTFSDAFFNSIEGKSTNSIREYRFLENAKVYRASRLKQIARAKRAKRLGFTSVLEPMTGTMRIPQIRKGIL